MAKAKNSFEVMARDAAGRLDKARAAGQQLTFLPDEDGSAADLVSEQSPGRPKGAKGMSQAAHDVIDERLRQQDKKGWTPEHDDQHTDESLALVAALYATPTPLFTASQDEGLFMFEDPWPSSWDDGWDHRDSHDHRRRLVIAGALILAEIERLDRAAAVKTDTPT